MGPGTKIPAEIESGSLLHKDSSFCGITSPDKQNSNRIPPPILKTWMTPPNVFLRSVGGLVVWNILRPILRHFNGVADTGSQPEELNKKAVAIINRVRDKLTGTHVEFSFLGKNWKLVPKKFSDFQMPRLLDQQ